MFTWEVNENMALTLWGKTFIDEVFIRETEDPQFVRETGTLGNNALGRPNNYGTRDMILLYLILIWI